MIARRWRVWTTRDKAAELEPYLQRTGVGEALNTPGNRGALLLRVDGDDGEVAFSLLTFWEGWEAIKAFAGADVDAAVLYPEDRAYFTRWDERVEHMTVVAWDRKLG